jgi:TRAP-type C4-dicarboxylate transport system permease small subunit
METSKDTGLLRRFNTLIKWFLAIMMMAMAGLSFYQVVMRYAFNSAPSWSEELVRFLFIWCSFVAAAIGVREHIHIGVDVFVNLLPKKLIPLTEIVVNLGIMVFSVYMIYYGWDVTVMTQRQPSPALGLPMSWVYLSVPVMGLLLLFYCSLEIFSAWKRLAEERGT